MYHKSTSQSSTQNIIRCPIPHPRLRYGDHEIRCRGTMCDCLFQVLTDLTIYFTDQLKLVVTTILQVRIGIDFCATRTTYHRLLVWKEVRKPLYHREHANKFSPSDYTSLWSLGTCFQGNDLCSLSAREEMSCSWKQDWCSMPRGTWIGLDKRRFHFRWCPN